MSDRFRLNLNATRRGWLAALAVAGVAFAAPAMACTTANWSSESGAVTAGDPMANSISRYQGECGLEVTGTGYVQDDRPGGIDRIVTRFYVLNELSGGQTAEVYNGYGDASGGDERFSVELDDTGQVTLIDTVSGQSVSQSSTNDFMSVEIDWGRGAGSGFISLSVDGQTVQETTGLTNDSGPSLASVRLGNMAGASGTLTFDSYEAHRSTAVGRLCNCNANGSGDDAVNMMRTCMALAKVDGRVIAFIEPIARYMTKDLYEEKDGGWSFDYPPPGAHIPFGEPGIYDENAGDLTKKKK